MLAVGSGVAAMVVAAPFDLARTRQAMYVKFRNFSFILATLSWTCVGIRRRRVLPCPVCA